MITTMTRPPGIQVMNTYGALISDCEGEADTEYDEVEPQRCEREPVEREKVRKGLAMRRTSVTVSPRHARRRFAESASRRR
jgi:hypothetical protein